MKLLVPILAVALAWQSDPPLIYRRARAEETCQEAITKALMTLEGIQNAFYILSTGKYLDNWGAYGSCLDSAKGEYWMATVSGNLVSEGENTGPPA